jgi:phosphoribosylamine--glycine ligase
VSPIQWKSGSAVSVVLASGGYPGEYETGLDIDGVEDAEREGAIVFHAGTAIKDGRLVTAGGRVLNVTVQDSTLGAALERAYRAAGRIRFKGVHYRRDIGSRALGNGEH